MVRVHIAQEREACRQRHCRPQLFAGGFPCLYGDLRKPSAGRDPARPYRQHILIAALYQSVHDASESCDEHDRIMDLLVAGDIEGAAMQMSSHIGNVESRRTKRVDADPLLDLRQALRQSIRKEGRYRC
jgi:hypothetical protein